MTRVDLDTIEERIAVVNPYKPPVDRGAERTLAVQDAPALVAELRAAREVVDAARLHRRSMERPGFSTCSCGVCCAVITHDQAVAP